jgi:hypothetical protein
VADAALKDLIPADGASLLLAFEETGYDDSPYEHNGNWLEIVPSVKGLATIYDKDILIYCISQIMEKLKRKEKVGPRVRTSQATTCLFTNRGTSGPRL